MRRISFEGMTVPQLVQEFTNIALAQDEANLAENTSKYNRLFDRMTLLKQELKGREGDQRRALLPLCDHPNAQVRLKAAQAVLAVAPDKARQTLELIVDRKEFPEAGYACDTLRALDQGHQYS